MMVYDAIGAPNRRNNSCRLQRQLDPGCFPQIKGNIPKTNVSDNQPSKTNMRASTRPVFVQYLLPSVEKGIVSESFQQAEFACPQFVLSLFMDYLGESEGLVVG